MLKQGIIMLASIPIVTASRQTFAAAAKSDFHYQDHPKGGKRCSDCSAFVPPQQGDSADGACRIITGPINPDGWCMAFTPK